MPEIQPWIGRIVTLYREIYARYAWLSMCRDKDERDLSGFGGLSAAWLDDTAVEIGPGGEAPGAECPGFQGDRARQSLAGWAIGSAAFFGWFKNILQYMSEV